MFLASSLQSLLTILTSVSSLTACRSLLITRVRPSVWIPAMELIWSTLTMILATSNGFNSLIAIRFFIGLAEATFYPAIQYVIGSWYKPDELAKRACLFHVRSVFGNEAPGFAYNLSDCLCHRPYVFGLLAGGACLYFTVNRVHQNPPTGRVQWPQRRLWSCWVEV